MACLAAALVACGSDGGLRAGKDAYTAIANTPLAVGQAPPARIAIALAGSVLDNDRGDTLTVTGVSAGTGTVDMAADGTFTYLPASGNTGNDTFTYQLTDGTETVTGQVTIRFAARVWYVDITTGGGNGTAQNPFGALGDVAGVVQPGDIVYVSGDFVSNGLDQDLVLTTPNVQLVGAGAALVAGGVPLAAAGSNPVITRTADAFLTIDAADNVAVRGLTFDSAPADAIRINDAVGVSLVGVSILNSGESAITGSGTAVGLALDDVTIVAVDTVDATTSDDAIELAATSAIDFTMTGGRIEGVPGSLGDAIVLSNPDANVPVVMDIHVSAVAFSDIGQDGIRIDNENGQVIAVIGGAEAGAGNVFSGVGHRGIVILADADPSRSRTNSLSIRHNTIDSGDAAVQIRGIGEAGNSTIADNTVTLAGGSQASAIDLQFDGSRKAQLRVDSNTVSGAGGSTGLRVRLFDGAAALVEARTNLFDNLGKAFDLSVREFTGLHDSRLDIGLTGNALQNIAPPALAMTAANHHSRSFTCLNLVNNTAVADYQVRVFDGTFDLASASQAVEVATGAIHDMPSRCPRPSF